MVLKLDCMHWIGLLIAYFSSVISISNYASLILGVLFFRTKHGPRTNMSHNFIPTMLTAGSCAMVMHNIKQFKINFCFVQSNLALEKPVIVIGLGPTGAYPSRFMCHATYGKYSQLYDTHFLCLHRMSPASFNNWFLMPLQAFRKRRSFL